MGYRSVIAFTVASLGLACGSSTKTCTPNGTTAELVDGGDCCGGSIYAGKCASKDCWTAGQLSNAIGTTSNRPDPTGENCCAGNGATLIATTYYCNPIPNCTAGGAVPAGNDEAYCCSAATYDGVCEPTYQVASGGGPNQCVPTSRVSNADGGSGDDCCAGAGASDGGMAYFCNARSGCTASGSAAVDPGSSDCCSGEANSEGICCSLTGQPGSSGTCCGGNGADGSGNCKPPTSCTLAGHPSVSRDGSDCCEGFASVYTGLCASPPL